MFLSDKIPRKVRCLVTWTEKNSLLLFLLQSLIFELMSFHLKVSYRGWLSKAIGETKWASIIL